MASDLFHSGGSGQRKLNVVAPEAKGYTGSYLIKTVGTKGCLYIYANTEQCGHLPFFVGCSAPHLFQFTITMYNTSLITYFMWLTHQTQVKICYYDYYWVIILGYFFLITTVDVFMSITYIKGP